MCALGCWNKISMCVYVSLSRAPWHFRHKSLRSTGPSGSIFSRSREVRQTTLTDKKAFSDATRGETARFSYTRRGGTCFVFTNSNRAARTMKLGPIVKRRKEKKNDCNSCRRNTVFKRRLIYKSLFTENSVATQKHSSASINTNKIQYKIQRSSPSQ